LRKTEAAEAASVKLWFLHTTFELAYTAKVVLFLVLLLFLLLLFLFGILFYF